MYVEDKVSHRGPFPIEVIAEQTVAELKKQIEKEFEIPADYQKWILGKELVTNENSTLKDHNITTEGCPVFLYLVAPDPKTKIDRAKSPKNEEKDAPSTSKIAVPLIEPKIVKEEIETPLTEPSNEEKIEKMKINVQNLQNKLNENKNNIKIIENTAPPTKVIDKKNITQLPKVIDHKIITQSSAVVDNTFTAQSTKVKGVDNSSITTQGTKLTNHVPKIVNVIPKEIKPKCEIIIPITIEQCETKSEAKFKPVLEIPISVTEIKIEQKPVPYKKHNNEIKQKNDYVIPKAHSSTQNIDIEPKLLPPALEKTQNITSTVQKNENTATNSKLELSSQKLQSLTENKVPPKAKEEDMDDYDSKTLKPSKEWECHLCTLLNPISSNICAVCATVRLTKAQPIKKSVKKKAPQPKIGETSAKKEQTYQQLVNLDNADLVENIETFECLVCFMEIPPHAGITLRECLHQFCKICLAHTIEYTEEAEVKCPYRDDDYSCNIALQDREIKALVSPVIYDQHLAKSVAQAENKMDKSFHCKTPDCRGWCIFEDNVNEFRCPVCRKTNCLTCQAVHIGMNCKQYQEKMNQECEIDDDARRTKQMLEEMVNRGEAIECPTCKVILMKKWGCDWLRCSMCKTEICWVTRGPRWGPAGKGDTSGGCQCGVNGVKCHPKCNYCH